MPPPRFAATSSKPARFPQPRALRAPVDRCRAVIFQPSSLPSGTRERFAGVVPAAHRCGTGVAHHAESARRAGDDPAPLHAPAAVAGSCSFHRPVLLPGVPIDGDFARTCGKLPADAG